MKKKILIAEDEQLHRFYLKRDIERARADIYEVVGEAANGIEMLKLWKQLSPDIIIADLKMPIFSGGEAIREIRRTDTLVKIIVLTGQEEKYLLEALNPFVDAYLFKSKEKPEDVLDKLDEVAGLKQEQTRKYVTSLLFEEDEYGTDASRQVVEKLLRGASNKEIASDLKISTKYVEKVLTKLFKKYLVKNRSELIAKIIELKES
ncbi:MAG: response regulator transcription factor [Ignavibacteria bacterium]|nr:response regulator transcription factor [Ignavibacteria bacterium]